MPSDLYEAYSNWASPTSALASADPRVFRSPARFSVTISKGRPNSRVISRHLAVARATFYISPVGRPRRVGQSSVNLPRQPCNSLPKTHSVKSFSRLKNKQFQPKSGYLTQMAARDTTVGSTPIGSAMPLGSGRKSSGWGMVRRHDRQGPQRCTGGWRLANLNDVVAVKHQRSAIGSQQVRFSEGLWSFLNHPIRFSLVRWGLEKGCSGPVGTRYFAPRSTSVGFGPSSP